MDRIENIVVDVFPFITGLPSPRRDHIPKNDHENTFLHDRLGLSIRLNLNLNLRLFVLAEVRQDGGRLLGDHVVFWIICNLCFDTFCIVTHDLIMVLSKFLPI